MSQPGKPESVFVRLSLARVSRGFIVAMIACYLLFSVTRWLSFPGHLLGVPVFVGGAWLAIAVKRYFQRHQTRLAIGAIQA